MNLLEFKNLTGMYPIEALGSNWERIIKDMKPNTWEQRKFELQKLRDKALKK